MRDDCLHPFPPVAELHDEERQTALRALAHARAEALARRRNVCAVFLSGSVARGPVGAGSDLDLHVVFANDPGPDLQPWTFHADGTLENIHLVPLDGLLAGHACAEHDTPFAEWCYATSLGDHLQGVHALHVSSAVRGLLETIRLVQDARNRTGVRSRLARRHRTAGAEWVGRARSHLGAGRLEDGLYCLRTGCQSLLVGALVDQGWYVRGAKKRPEIACALARDDGVRECLRLLLDVVGISTSTREDTVALGEQRHAFRSTYVGVLEELCRTWGLPDDRAQRLEAYRWSEARHNRSAHNYYDALVRDGFWRGALNHMRALSGLHLVPSRLVEAWHGEVGPTPILQLRALIGHHAAFQPWWAVMAYDTDAGVLSEWVRRAEALARPAGTVGAV